METSTIMNTMRAKAAAGNPHDNVSFVQYPATKDEDVVVGPLGTGEYCMLTLTAEAIRSMSDTDLRAEIEAASKP